jgi:hypothetical protein
VNGCLADQLAQAAIEAFHCVLCRPLAAAAELDAFEAEWGKL